MHKHSTYVKYILLPLQCVFEVEFDSDYINILLYIDSEKFLEKSNNDQYYI